MDIKNGYVNVKNLNTFPIQEMDNLFNISSLIKERKLEVPKKKVDFEFQALGLELQEMFPATKKGAIWGLFYNPKFTEAKIRDSMKAYRQQGVRDFRYFLGILHKK